MEFISLLHLDHEAVSWKDLAPRKTQETQFVTRRTVLLCSFPCDEWGTATARFQWFQMRDVLGMRIDLGNNHTNRMNV